MSSVGKGSQYYSGFSPTSIPGCALWLDGADSTTLTLSGSNVTQWNDKSGNGYSLVQATTSNQPTYLLNVVNGLGGVETNRSRFLFKSGSNISNFAYGTNTSAFFVIRNASTNGGWNIFATMYFTATGSQTSKSRWHFSVNQGGTQGLTIIIGSTTYQNTSFTIPTSTAAIVGFTTSPSSTLLDLNGSISTYSGVTMSNADDGIGLALADTRDTTATTNTVICEMIGFNTQLTTTERQQIEGYLANKWGLSTSLPTTHPYYSAPSIPSPLSISGCALWLDAADSTTLTLSGSNVTQWNDKSGNANNAVRSTIVTSALGPTRNSSNTLLFTRTGSSVQMLRTQTGRQTTQPVTFMLVFRVIADNPSGDGAFFDYRKNPGIYSLNQTLIRRLGATTALADFNYSWPTTQIVFAMQASSNTFSAFVNGTQILNSTLALDMPAADGGYLTIGALTDINNTYASLIQYTNSSEFGELLMFNSFLSTSQRQQIEGYLANKWGLASSLPSTHPYRFLRAIPKLPFLRPFSPLDVSGCSLWLDAADSTTLTLSGSNVTQWNDKSGNGRNAASTSADATFSNSGLLFSNNFYTTTYPANPVNETFFTIFTTASTLNSSSNGLIGSQNGGRVILVGHGGNSNQFGVNASGVSSGAGITGLTTSTRFLGIIQISNTTSTSASLNGGSLTAPVTITAFTAGTTTTIGRETSTQYAFNGIVHELLAYSAVLTTTERQQVEGYLADKWGLRGNLPSTHPLKLYKALSVPFNPVQTSGCALWLDAADSGTLVLSGSNVTQWNDKSSSGLLFSPPVGSNPTLSQNGPLQQSVLFTTTQSLSSSSNATLGPTQSWFVVFRSISSSNFFFIEHSSNVNNTDGSFLYGGNGDLFAARRTSANLIIDNIGFNVSPFTSNTNYLASFVSSNTNPGLLWKINGTDRTAVYRTTFTALSGSVARQFFINSRVTANNYIGEVLIYDGALSSNQVQVIEGYLAWKWGLNRSLPSTHPYYKFNPS